MARTARRWHEWDLLVPFEESMAMEGQSLRLRRLLAGGYIIERLPRRPALDPARPTRRMTPARIDA